MTSTPHLAALRNLGVEFALSGNRVHSPQRRCELTPYVRRRINESAVEIAAELYAIRLIAAALEEAKEHP